MNAVGIDVSKGKSMVAIMRPFGEIVSTPFEIKHTTSDINSLVELINSVEGESRIVMEHTGRYYEILAHQLSEANLFVSAINPKLIKDFDNDSLRKVKSDKADAVKIARYALDKWQNLKQYNVMDELRNQINAVREEHVVGTSYISKAWTRASDAIGTPIVKLTTALWDQQAPFNRLSPTTSDGKSITGCVATAMAIIMQYYQWPDQGVGTVPVYTLQADKNTQIPSKTFDRPYVWSKMPVKVDKNSDTDIKDEVATLIYDCGIISKSQFGRKSTWAYYENALEGMIKYMKYNKGTHMQNRATRVMSEWHQMLRKELDAKRPILYTASTKSGGGHMFVIDGYTQENYYHVNWGWSGSSNGYYLLTVMDPSNPGSGSSSGGYTQEQAAFFNLIPDKDGTSAFTDNLVLIRKEVNGVYYEGLVMDAVNIQPEQEFKISIGAVNNIGRSAFDGNLRIALVGKNGTIKEYISEEIPVKYPADSYHSETDCFCKITLPIKAGDRIRVYYKGKYSEDWEYCGVAHY